MAPGLPTVHGVEGGVQFCPSGQGESRMRSLPGCSTTGYAKAHPLRPPQSSGNTHSTPPSSRRSDCLARLGDVARSGDRCCGKGSVGESGRGRGQRFNRRRSPMEVHPSLPGRPSRGLPSALCGQISTMSFCRSAGCAR